MKSNNVKSSGWPSLAKSRRRAQNERLDDEKWHRNAFVLVGVVFCCKWRFVFRIMRNPLPNFDFVVHFTDIASSLLFSFASGEFYVDEFMASSYDYFAQSMCSRRSAMTQEICRQWIETETSNQGFATTFFFSFVYSWHYFLWLSAFASATDRKPRILTCSHKFSAANPLDVNEMGKKYWKRATLGIWCTFIFACLSCCCCCFPFCSLSVHTQRWRWHWLTDDTHMNFRLFVAKMFLFRWDLKMIYLSLTLTLALCAFFRWIFSDLKNNKR